MSIQNPYISNCVLCATDGTADSPSLRWGGELSGGGGTGLYGDFSSINASVAGSKVIGISSSGLSVTGAASVSSTFTVAGIVIITGAGAPVDGTTGDDIAGKGSLYSDKTNGILYINTGAIDNPTWVKVGTQS